MAQVPKEMTMSTAVGARGRLVPANGTHLYCEIRGRGPAVLFIPGATGDGGMFEGVAEALSDEFTVITYDRRANSRSPKPEGWTATTIREQADDAVALLETLAFAPTAIFANSFGGAIGLEMLLTQPDLVRGALLHEPAMSMVILDQLPRAAGEHWVELTAAIQAALVDGGARAAMEAFIRDVRGDPGFETMDPALRERMVANGETWFQLEWGALANYRPDEEAIAAIHRPVKVLLGRETTLLEMPVVCNWLAPLLKADVKLVPGGHTAFIDTPEEFAEAIRPALREVVA
jgi:pimeloyl-ACP methyl ester carboxylesterase